MRLCPPLRACKAGPVDRLAGQANCRRKATLLTGPVERIRTYLLRKINEQYRQGPDGAGYIVLWVGMPPIGIWTTLSAQG